MWNARPSCAQLCSLESISRTCSSLCDDASIASWSLLISAVANRRERSAYVTAPLLLVSTAAIKVEASLSLNPRFRQSCPMMSRNSLYVKNPVPQHVRSERSHSCNECKQEPPPPGGYVPLPSDFILRKRGRTEKFICFFCCASCSLKRVTM